MVQHIGGGREKIIIGLGDKGRRVSPGYKNGTVMVVYQTRLGAMGRPRHSEKCHWEVEGKGMTVQIDLPLAPLSATQTSLGLKALSAIGQLDCIECNNVWSLAQICAEP